LFVAIVLSVAAATLAGCRDVSSTVGRGTVSSAPRIVIDTDLSLWWDDVTAIGMANVLEQHGKVRVLGIMSDVRNPLAVAAIDAIDTAYGHGAIPLGAVSDSAADTAPHGYSDSLVAKLPHAVKSSRDVPGAVALYRRILAGQPDHSVTIVSIGGYTNLAGLLDSSPGPGSPLKGVALVEAKVKRIVIEDGLFPGGSPVPFTNTKLDVAAARRVVGAWPSPVAWVDGFTGEATRVGGALCTSVGPSNPMRIAYEALFGCGPPGDGDWDGPTLLYAVGGKQGLFSELGGGGSAVMNARGGLSWRPGCKGDQVYVHVVHQQALNARIDALLAAR
jgi:pyrimidine-specific ribonucleoside hydrolase